MAHCQMPLVSPDRGGEGGVERERESEREIEKYGGRERVLVGEREGR